ncbi:MAG: LysM peptidoglycan-binding domain-containing M23 family metallopeptidase [Methylobacteriaceae bacterium]|nr:LysM peptidoglycan-binding domain-containing M23 family metallopeptidase [Methylobacteriaceae bacterium]
MRERSLSGLWRAGSRVALITAVGGLAGACSADAARFSDNPFSNPFASRDVAEPKMTGSLGPKKPAGAVRTGAVASAPLAPPPAARVAAASAAASAETPTRYASSAPAGWTATGGTAITVGQGDSLAAISNRYGVPTGAILSANGVTAAQVTPGRRIIIPIYNAAGAPAAMPARKVEAAPAAAPAVQSVAAAAPAPAAGRVVATAKLPPKPAPAKVAAAEPAKPHVRPGQPARAPAPAPLHATARPVPAEAKSTAAIQHPRPGRTLAKTETSRSEAPKPEPVAKVAAKPEAKPAKVAEAKPAKLADAKPAPAPAATAKPAAPAAKPLEPAKVAAATPPKTALPAREPETTASLPVQPVAPAPAAPAAPTAEFRWPARGRVISGFGGQGGNEGINIAVPEGTAVKAAESGTVAYAGNEVKGYGNLVLIRHDNGYVSAYAHNGEVEVKRGQKVARGQVIAKSGQSGNVTSPQIHFEIRRGANPVDPVPYLASN